MRIVDNEVTVLSSACDSFLGREDIDEPIVHYICDEFLKSSSIDMADDIHPMQRVRDAAERLKIGFADNDRCDLKIENFTYGIDGRSLDLRVSIPRQVFREKVQTLTYRTFAVCDEALRLAKLNVSALSAFVMVGGTSKIPIVQDMASSYFGLTPAPWANRIRPLSHLTVPVERVAIRRLPMEGPVGMEAHR